MLPRFQSAAFLAAYATLTWLVVWFNTAVLGLGDVKFGGGYGGQEIYYPLWLIAFAPAALLAIRAILKLDAAPSISWTFTVALLLVLMVAMSLCFALDAGWVVLIAITSLYGVAAAWAARALSRRCNRYARHVALNPRTETRSNSTASGTDC